MRTSGRTLRTGGGSDRGAITADSGSGFGTAMCAVRDAPWKAGFLQTFNRKPAIANLRTKRER